VIDTEAACAKPDNCSQPFTPAQKKPIPCVINAYGHPDHVFGDAAFFRDGTKLSAARLAVIEELRAISALRLVPGHRSVNERRAAVCRDWLGTMAMRTARRLQCVHIRFTIAKRDGTVANSAHQKHLTSASA
jgi:hypothetical protein